MNVLAVAIWSFQANCALQGAAPLSGVRLVLPGRCSTRRSVDPQCCLSAAATANLEEAVDEILMLMQSLPPDLREAMPTELSPMPPQLRPMAAATDLSVQRIQQACKAILASQANPHERLEAVAELSSRALASGRAEAAAVAFELGARRLNRWRATSTRPPDACAALIEAGLLTAIARRAQGTYESILRSAQERSESRSRTPLSGGWTS